MKNSILTEFEKDYFREKPLPRFKAGDTVVVWVKVQEGKDKFRLQAFEGLCLRYKKGTTNSSFKIRKIGAAGIAVERDFLVHSPIIEKIDIKLRGKVRQSRIYYIRNLKGKAARIKSTRAKREDQQA